MKCDELKRHRPDIMVLGEGKALAVMADDPMGVWCHIQDVHDILDEKDKEIAELKKKLMPCLNGDCILTCEVVEKYGKENAELKQKLESVQASMYCDVVDANMENRKLRRALWIARALRAKECKYKYETWERHEERKVYKDYDMIAIVSRKARIWRKIERICIKKAEEYK